MCNYYLASFPVPRPAFRRLQYGKAGLALAPTLPYCKGRKAGRGTGNEAKYYQLDVSAQHHWTRVSAVSRYLQIIHSVSVLTQDITANCCSVDNGGCVAGLNGRRRRRKEVCTCRQATPAQETTPIPADTVVAQCYHKWYVRLGINTRDCRL